MTERFGAQDVRSPSLAVFTPKRQASRLPAQQPRNNIARVAIQGAGSGCWGARRACIPTGFDEGPGIADRRRGPAFALRTAADPGLRVKGVANTVEPSGWVVFLWKRVTLDMEQGAFLATFDKLDAMGGMVRAI